MPTLQLPRHNLTIGGADLCVIAGLNVLEDEGLALEVAGHLKSVTEALGLPFVFKASFDKANRSSLDSYRGPGLDPGLRMLTAVKAKHDLPIASDIHEPGQAERASEVIDVLQIPAFLCRQTDLIVSAAKAAKASDGWLHVKKGQFLAPLDCGNIVAKARDAIGEDRVVLCERGVSFGYNNLVVDMLGIEQMRGLGCPVTIDATHSVQLPGADPRTGGKSTGGRRNGVATIACAAVAAGVDGVFLEFHPDPDKALCDGPSCLPLSSAEALLAKLKAFHRVARQ
jgi:2-dehydro-3-deoxyphosphooctonate aldolase (KDO 8-P synthase)